MCIRDRLRIVRVQARLRTLRATVQVTLRSLQATAHALRATMQITLRPLRATSLLRATVQATLRIVRVQARLRSRVKSLQATMQTTLQVMVTLRPLRATSLLRATAVQATLRILRATFQPSPLRFSRHSCQQRQSSGHHLLHQQRHTQRLQW